MCDLFGNWEAVPPKRTKRLINNSLILPSYHENMTEDQESCMDNIDTIRRQVSYFKVLLY